MTDMLQRGDLAGLPIQILDLDQAIIPQLDAILREVIRLARGIMRIDLSPAVLERFDAELARLPHAQRIATESISDRPMVWQWRRVPIVEHRSLPDCAAGVILETPEKATFRGLAGAPLAPIPQPLPPALNS